MPHSVIYLQPRSVTIEHCESCGLTHAHEETSCVAGKSPHDQGHCIHWWDAEACCWCGDDPCAAARCALG